jgi:hypothetical protein
LTPAKPVTSLYANELVLLESNGDCGRPDVDKWLAIALGGLIAKEKSPREYYFEDAERGAQFFQLIQDSPQRKAPDWLKWTTAGIFHRLKLKGASFNALTLTTFDFNDAKIDNVYFYHCFLQCDFSDSSQHEVGMVSCTVDCKFDRSSLVKIIFSRSELLGSFRELVCLNDIGLSNVEFDGWLMPSLLQVRLSQRFFVPTVPMQVIGYMYIKNGDLFSRAGNCLPSKTLGTLIDSALTLNIFTKEDVSSSFEFMSKMIRNEFARRWVNELAPLLTNIRNDPEYLELERQYYKQRSTRDRVVNKP